MDGETRERLERMNRRYIELMGIDATQPTISFRELAKKITCRIPIKGHNI